MRFFLPVLLLAPAVLAEDVHDHGSCACEAEEFGFTIDCTNTEAMTTAMSALIADGCDQDCLSATCEKNFFIVQAHHDYCLHEEVPAAVLDGFHDFEGICHECDIVKKRDPALSDCPKAVCDGRGDDAYQGLLEDGCMNGCNSTTCGDSYRILRSEHDNCGHDTMSATSAKGLHSFEEVCAVENCNSLATDEEVADQLVCHDHDEHDHEEHDHDEHDHDEHDHEEDHEDHDEHDHGSCACEAEKYGFTIDCSDTDAMTTAMAALIADGCDQDCLSATCETNFFIVQAHHDYCLHEEVPTVILDGFHDFEGICHECDIVKKRDPALADCPKAVCDGRGDDAYQGLLEDGCMDGCNGATCGDSYRILRSEHDNCGHDTMSATSAKGLHSFEEVCAVENCNSLATDEEVADQLVCHDHDEHDHEEHDHEEEETGAMGSDSAGVASQVSGLFAILLGIAFLAIS